MTTEEILMCAAAFLLGAMATASVAPWVQKVNAAVRRYSERDERRAHVDDRE